jgi:hypothetical protein
VGMGFRGGRWTGVVSLLAIAYSDPIHANSFILTSH